MGGLAREILTGKTLFQARDLKTLREEHRVFKRPAVSAALPGIGEDLRGFLAGCLVRDPARRSADLEAIASWSGRLRYEDLAAAKSRERPP